MSIELRKDKLGFSMVSSLLCYLVFIYLEYINVDNKKLVIGFFITIVISMLITIPFSFEKYGNGFIYDKDNKDDS